MITVTVTLEMFIKESEINPSHRNEESIIDIVDTLIDEIPCGIDGCNLHNKEIKVEIV